MLRLSQLPWGLAMALMASLATASPAVNVGMNAAFPRGPYLLELLETAAGENSTSYFPLLDKIASGHFAPASSDAELYDQFLEVLQQDGHIASPDALSTFKLALSLRSAAPRIEAHYQYYSTAVDPTTEDVDEKCQSWALVDNKKYCSPTLDAAAESDLSSKQTNVLPFDRVLGIGKDAVLYADPTSASFGPFHEALSKAAKQGDISYRLRYRRSAAQSSPLPVSGYGVELALKRTDYIVIDDREAGKDAPQKPVAADVVLDEEEEVTDLKPLSTSELASLGLKTASFILKSENPFETLVKASQDFPKFSRSIIAHEFSKEFKEEQEKNVAAGVPTGINFLWMNGVQLIERQIEPFNLIDMIRRERKLINGVRALGFNGQQAVSLLGHSEIANAKADDEPTRFDWTDRSEDGKVFIWLNDLEKDDQYAELPKELKALLRRTYPGQLPQVALNLFHIIAPVDFTNLQDVRAFSQLAQFMQRGLTIRFGIAPLTSTPAAAAAGKIVYHLMETYGLESLVAYLSECEEGSKTGVDKKAFVKAVEGREPLPETTKMTLDEVLEAESYTQKIKAAQAWANRLNADTTVRPVFVDGFAIPREKNWVQTMGQRLTEDTQIIQKAVYLGEIDEESWVPGVFLNKALAKRNTYIFPDDDKSLRVLDVNKLYTDHADLFSKVAVLEANAESTKETWAILTVVTDLNTEDGQDLLVSALQFKRANPGIRLELVHNPSSPTDAHAINGAFKTNTAKLAEIESKDELKGILEASWTGEDDGFGNALAGFLTTAKILPGTKALLLNGRVVGPLPTNVLFKEDDLQQLLDFEQRNRILPVYAAIEDLGFADKLSDPVAAAKLTSITALSTISDLPQGIFESAPSVRTTLYSTWDSTHTAIEIGNPETASIHIAGLLNPTSEQGQKWAPILKVLSELDGVYLKLIINPKEVVSELPIKRFFRYVLNSAPSFDKDGHVEGPKAVFKGLPSEALLTAGMDVPPAWLVAPKASVHDLDNIKLGSVKADVDATYELENILIEGHSRDGKRGAPRGAQLVLATEKDPLVTDTIIMANLGYFQFKANPGYYNIQLKEGRSADIFTIESVGAQGYSAVPGDEGTEVALMDFKGTTLYPRLERKPGMGEADVLATTDDEDKGIVAKGLKFAESLLGASKTHKEISAQEHAEINIFSVASGHLYERMLNIMMVSVMRNTKHTVKFWFIEQFLSPSFKDFIPHMAAEYGFKYEMVTYKWPHWLRQQKEKQREIWGYKILFLDVLFPLSLDKVIFVDADQIVRTDMIDLVNHDLKGAPYGFTPMCDSRTEMEGFRFWKQGYWANYLRGLPYHISALYVVDLHRFRQLAAGDRLRQQYHTLSADPNSLSNLDQDLPNNMQFTIPIHSLPQEWLWCETWCSDESLSSARTIDLCNNPQTKEPKLDRARRQVPEWTVYDDEIAALDQRRKGAEEKNTKSRKLEEETHTKDEL